MQAFVGSTINGCENADSGREFSSITKLPNDLSKDWHTFQAIFS